MNNIIFGGKKKIRLLHIKEKSINTYTDEFHALSSMWRQLLLHVTAFKSKVIEKEKYLLTDDTKQSRRSVP